MVKLSLLLEAQIHTGKTLPPLNEAQALSRSPPLFRTRTASLPGAGLQEAVLPLNSNSTAHCLGQEGLL